MFLQIFENGVISRDPNIILTKCPTEITKKSYISAFWQPTDITKSGKVYYREEVKNSTGKLWKKDIGKLLAEVSRGVSDIDDDYYRNDSQGLTADRVKSMVVITWFEMVQPSSEFVNVGK